MPVKSATLRMRLAAMAMRVLGLTGSPRQSSGSAPSPTAWRQQKDEGPLQIHPLDAVIAQRSERVSNRDSATAAAYRRVHTILSRGR